MRVPYLAVILELHTPFRKLGKCVPVLVQEELACLLAFVHRDVFCPQHALAISICHLIRLDSIVVILARRWIWRGCGLGVVGGHD